MVNETIAALLLSRQASSRGIVHVSVVCLVAAGSQDSDVRSIQLHKSRLLRAEDEGYNGAKPAHPSNGDVGDDGSLVLVCSAPKNVSDAALETGETREALGVPMRILTTSVGTLKSEESVDGGLRNPGLRNLAAASSHDDL